MNIKMPKELKEKWLTALRSGDFYQCKARLKDEEHESFCCLGVLQMVADGDVERRGGENGPTFSLPSTGWLQEHNIQSDPAFTVQVGAVGTSLAELNDDGYTFNSIADLVEEHVEGF